MSTNGINVSEDAEMSDCDGEKVVTMMDVLREQEDFEEDANAVLGASDDKNCTYSKGYVKRQAIYACMTCCTDARNDPTKWAGVCLACSLNCHENHELIELYTKRNFRCDCGNPKFNSHPCQFTPDKTDLNVENIYNQNFSGLYCICHRPYPDLESSTQGDMIQCIICEDWLHSNHLDAVVPSNDQYSEMICKACMEKNEFLHDYSDLAINKDDMDVDILNTSSEVKIVKCNGDSETEMVENDNFSNCNNDIGNEQTEVEVANNDETEIKEQSDSKAESAEENSIKEQQSSIETSVSEVTAEELPETNLTLNEETHCGLENDKKTEAEQKNETQSEKTSMSLQTTQESDVTVNKESSKVTSISKAVIADNRSQEQVEEDLLLADPMELDLDQKDSKSDVTPSTTDQSTPGAPSELINEKKDVCEEMEASETAGGQIENETEDKTELKHEPNNIHVIEESENVAIVDTSDNLVVVKESESVADSRETETVATIEESQNVITEQSENVTTDKQTAGTLETEQLEEVPTTEDSDCKKTENVASIEHSEGLSTTEPTEQTEATSASGQAENIPTPKAQKNYCDNRSETVFTTEESVNCSTQQLDPQNKNDDFGNENSTTSSETKNSLEKNSSVDVIMGELIVPPPENEEDNTTLGEGTEINSICNSELPKINLESDILKRKISSDGDVETIEVKKPKLDETNCVRPKGVKKVHHGATFWPSNFRHKLCTCNECISMYRDLSVLFLIDPDDTVTAYERLGKEKIDGKPASQYEKGMAALSSLGRVQQINALTEYAKLRDKLLDFLKTFKDKKVIVKEEDIKAFFAGMKPKREPDGVYFCR